MARIAVMLSISPEMLNAIDSIAHLDRRSRQDVIRLALEIALPGMTQGVPPLDAEASPPEGRTVRHFTASKIARARLALARAEERARHPSPVPAYQEIQRLQLDVAREALREAMGEPAPAQATRPRTNPFGDSGASEPDTATRRTKIEKTP